MSAARGGARRLLAALRRPHPMRLAVPFAALTVLAAHGQTRRTADTHSYFVLHFFGKGGSRLWTVPLLFTHLSGDSQIHAAQTFISFLCWCALAYQLQASLRRTAARWVAVGLVFAIGLSEQVTFWDHWILSESLSISMSVLLIAAWLAMARRPDWKRLIAVLVATTLWLFCRQAQAVISVALVVPPLLVWLAARRRRIYLLLAALTAAVSAWGVYDSFQGSTYIQVFNASDVICARVLTNPAEEHFFESRGMPVSRELQATAGDFIGNFRTVASDLPLLRWIEKDYNRTLEAWVIRHPLPAIVDPAVKAPALIADPQSRTGHGRDVLTPPVQAVLDNGWVTGLANLAVIVGSAVLLVRRRQLPAAATVGLFGIAFCYLWSAEIWNTVADDLVRLYAPVGTADRALVVVAGMALVDDWLTRRRAAADDAAALPAAAAAPAHAEPAAVGAGT